MIKTPTNATLTPIAPTNSEFCVVNSHSDKKIIEDLKNIFVKTLTPLYGSQEDAINKILLSKDRVCHLLYENTDPVGVIVFKKILTDEFAEMGIKRSIEIKSLFVVNSANNSGRGLGSRLLNKVIEESRKLRLQHDSLHVTVSETKKESLMFFLNKEFDIKYMWKGRYKENVIEYLLCRSEKQKLQDSTAHQAALLSKNLSSLHLNSANPSEGGLKTDLRFSAKILGHVTNAHWDDIHVLKLLSDGTFITGSKDNTLRKWDSNGKLVRVVLDVEPMDIESKNWITAMGILNDEYWVSGERNGRISLWNTAGDYVRDLKPRLPKQKHISHAHNALRVNCFATGLNKQKPSFFIGFPTIFDEYNLIEDKTVSSTEASRNDWVYCIHPLNEKNLLTVTAGFLNIWDQDSKGNWNRGKAYIREPKSANSPGALRNRHHITSLTPLSHSSTHFGIGAFDGSVKVVDISIPNDSIVNQWKEHKGKVWSIENIASQVIASGSDDGMIKLWDIRESKSVHTIKDPLGGVSTLLRLNENVLIAGSCSKTPLESNKGAQLTFYDIRK
ncbi:MAG: hypothetical protein BGO14_03170 [Chlamydiales bacterium 38-26]|nr:MAG: hypothetical protein BGO14_03170 [Chlamydiales bacterium 38-26]